MAYDFDRNVADTIMEHIRIVGGRKAELETWDSVLGDMVQIDCQALVDGRRRKPDASIHIAYVLNRAELERERGNKDQADWLRRFGRHLESQYPGAMKERRG